ncbi:MAG: acetyl-CoA carboxylase biotin carboxylase subunit [Deferribacterota bacterium]|nr:acetyl-CoA carboxylase biotin carboxylase subunit [Deferribacterota bacterium]
MAKIDKVLVANRGEIAIRIFRTCRKMGIRTIAIYTHADRKAPHVRYADEAYLISDNKDDHTYLKKDKIIDIAKKTNAAIHPGYGFYAENADFAQSVEDAGLIFIGPHPKHINDMGSKTAARHIMNSAGVPIIPGTKNPIRDINEAKKVAVDIGLPIMLKAVYGGGGKGMRIIKDIKDFEPSFRLATSEAQSSFGNGDLYIEKYIEEPHHVEVQVLGDKHGNYVHLFERECSIQRRHQKLIEETPSPFIDDNTRKEMFEVAVKAIKTIGYISAGTLEFIVGKDKKFYFLEMNTRLQVEHPITEIVTGVDIVREMILIAEDKQISYKQDEIKRDGHAIECRICAEDPTNNFMPSPGLIKVYHAPEGPNVRVESGVYDGYEIPLFYDPLMAKVCAHDKTRYGAIINMRRILSEFILLGIKSNIPFHQSVLKNNTFIKGIYDTGFIDNQFNVEEMQRRKEEDPSVAIIAASIKQLLSEKKAAAESLTEKEGVYENNWKRIGRLMNIQRLF